MAEPSTTTVMSAFDSLASTAAGALVPSLVIVWSRHEPERVGEVAHFESDGEWTLGRSGGSGRRVRFARQRPGASPDTGELRAHRISRDQLAITRDGVTLHLRNLGRGTLRIGEAPVEAAAVGPGDLVVLDRALILCCALRPPLVGGALAAAEADFDFGGPDSDGWVGESTEAWQLRQRITWCATAPGHLLLTGPSGAGKALVARAVHRRGRPDGPYVERNAAALDDGALAAELFGTTHQARIGAFEQADGGTLLLDALGRVSAAAQTHLLDALDQGSFRPVGAEVSRRADVRVIGVGNRALTGLEADFLARFPLRLDVPGLDARRADITLIARHLLDEMARAQPALFPEGAPRLHPRLAEALLRRRYTGHVRELAATLWAAVEVWSANGRGKYLDLPDDSARPVSSAPPAPPAPMKPAPAAPEPGPEPTEPTAHHLDAAAELQLWPSLDGESCRAALRFGETIVELPPRASHLLLLAAARERVNDAARGLPESEQGWLYAEVLADGLDVDRQRLNTEVYRARRQLDQLGITGTELLFERRPQTRQIRLGLGRVLIDEPAD